jgi:hypothetical protein
MVSRYLKGKGWFSFLRSYKEGKMIFPSEVIVHFKDRTSLYKLTEDKKFVVKKDSVESEVSPKGEIEGYEWEAWEPVAIRGSNRLRQLICHLVEERDYNYLTLTVYKPPQ